MVKTNVLLAEVKAVTGLKNLQEKAALRLGSKKDGVSGVVVAVILTIVGVSLCALFRTQAKSFLQSMFTTLTTTANGLFS